MIMSQTEPGILVLEMFQLANMATSQAQGVNLENNFIGMGWRRFEFIFISELAV